MEIAGNDEYEKVMKEEMQVSVVMSVYNGERFLREAIESILNQSYNDFEFLIVDDHSEDGSYDILRSYDDRRIILIRNEGNMGLTRSLNKAIAVSKAKYIARQDADDVSAENRLGIQVAYMEEHGSCDVAGTYAYIIDEKGMQIGVLEHPTDFNSVAHCLKTDNCIVHGSVIMRRSAFESASGYDELFVRSQDYELWLRLLKQHRLENVGKYLYSRRKHSQTIEATSFYSQKIMAAFAKVKNGIPVSDTAEYLTEKIQRYSVNKDTRFCPISSLVNNTMKGRRKKISTRRIASLLNRLQMNEQSFCDIEAEILNEVGK